MDIIELYCDGACRGNGQKENLGGWGVYIKYKGKEKRVKGYALNTTNNIMELESCLQGLQLFKEKSIPIVLTTDSEYVCKGVNIWSLKWRVNGWRNSKRKPIENKELWMRLLKLIESFETIQFVHCFGHASTEGNVIADQLANDAMDHYLAN